MSGNKAPACPTARQALAQAMLAAVEHPDGGRLAEVTFGRFAAEGDGWYWQLKFTLDVTSEPRHAHNDESIERRIWIVTDAWCQEMEKRPVEMMS